MSDIELDPSTINQRFSNWKTLILPPANHVDVHSSLDKTEARDLVFTNHGMGIGQ